MKLRYPIFCFALISLMLGGCMLPGFTRSERMLRSADEAFREGRIDEARRQYQNTMARYATKDAHTYLSAAYRLGQVMLRSGDTAHAEALFQHMLVYNPDTTEEDETERQLSKQAYNIYKNSAAQELAAMRFQAGNFRESVAYLAMADTVYTYSARCGNCSEAGAINMANKYADCYEKMGAVDEAIRVLAPHMHKIGLANVEETVQRCARLLIERYSSEERRRFAEEGDAGMRIVREEMNVYGHKYTLIRAYVPLFGTEIEVYERGYPQPEMLAKPDIDASDEVWLAYYRKIFRNDRLYAFLSTGKV